MNPPQAKRNFWFTPHASHLTRNYCMIRLVNLNKSFKDQQVLRDLNLTIPSGQTTVIIGLSGGGGRAFCLNTLWG